MMRAKTHQRQIVLLSALFGILAWILDGVADYFIFYRGEGSFAEILFLNPPAHELYARSLLFLLLVLFGLIAAWLVRRRVEAENRARLFESQHGLLSRASPEAILGIDAEGRPAGINPQALELFGAADEDEFLKHFPRFGDLFVPEDRERAEEDRQRALAEGIARDVNINGLRRDGRAFPMEISLAAPAADAPGPVRLVMVARDISARRRAEEEIQQSYEELQSQREELEVMNEELRQTNEQLVQTSEELRSAEERLRRVVQNMPVMMDAFDAGGAVVAWNAECERVTGYSADEMIGNTNALELLYPNPNYRAEVLRAVSENWGCFHNLEFELTTKDGLKRTIAWSNISRDFAVAGWDSWAIGVDVTERRQAEAILALERKLAMSLATATDLDEAFSEILDASCELPHIDAAGIYRTGEKNAGIRLVAHRGISERFLDLVREPDADDPYNHAVLQGRPLHMPTRDFPENEIRTAMLDEGFAFTSLVPLLHDGKVAGALTLSTRQAGELPKNICDAAEILAVNLGDILNRIRAQEALEESAAQRRRILESVSDGFFALDRDLAVTYFNEAAEKILGRERDAVLGIPLFEAFPEAKGSVFEEKYRAALREKRADHFEVFFDTEPYSNWYDVRVYPQRDGLTVFFQVTTERKRAEETLRRERDRAQLYLDIAGVILVALGREGEVTLINQRGCEVLGAPEEEILDSDWFDSYIPESERQQTRAEYLRIMEGGGETASSFENRILRADGEERLIAWNNTLLHDEAGNISGTLSSGEDITEQRRAETRLRESEKNLSITLDSIGDAVIATDAEGRVTRLNRVAERLTGWTEEESAGKPLAEIFTIYSAKTGEPVANPVDRVLAEGRIFGLANHTVLVARDGSERQIADSAAPILDHGEAIAGVVLVFRDVTDQYRLEEQLRHSQKMEAIGQLAGGVAHDFNNMLGGIIGYAEIMQARYEDDKQIDRYAGQIIKAAERAAELTEKLLAFSRKGRMQSVPVDAHAIIEEVVSLLGETIDRRIVIRTRLDAQVHSVVGDPTQLQTAILNLGVNGRDAMPDGGELLFSTRVISPEDMAASFNSPMAAACGGSGCLEIEVRDSGIGIDPDITGRIFEPFFTTKGVGKGTGLGLAAVYGIAQDHGGCVTVESQQSQGSRFRLCLPLDPESAAAPVAAPPDAIIRGSGRILLADDEETIRAMAAQLLESMGYGVLLANDGQEAVERFEAERETIDLVILDLVMPRLDGRDAFRAIRAIDPEIPVLISSGYTRGMDIDDLADHKTAYIQKPYRSLLLSQTVAAILKQSG